jgi:hypothetical protein
MHPEHVLCQIDANGASLSMDALSFTLCFDIMSLVHHNAERGERQVDSTPSPPDRSLKIAMTLR